MDNDPNAQFLENMTSDEQLDLDEAKHLLGADEDGIASGNVTDTEFLGGSEESFAVDGNETVQ